MNILENPNLNQITLILFLLGVFLLMSGLNIIKIEKVTVASGKKTWIAGLLLILISAVLYANSNKNNPELKIVNNVVKNEEVSVNKKEKSEKKTILKAPKSNDKSNEKNKFTKGLVFDPPSNIRDNPDGEILCVVSEKKNIFIKPVYYKEVLWFKTTECGNVGYIHNSQVRKTK